MIAEPHGIGSFKSGPFYLALAVGMDIVPFVIDGRFAYNSKGT